MTSVLTPLDSKNASPHKYLDFIDQSAEKSVYRILYRNQLVACQRDVDFEYSVYCMRGDEFQANELRHQQSLQIMQEQRQQHEIWLQKRQHEDEEAAQDRHHRRENQLGKRITRSLKFERVKIKSIMTSHQAEFEDNYKKLEKGLPQEPSVKDADSERQFLEMQRAYDSEERIMCCHKLQHQNFLFLRERHQQHKKLMKRRQVQHERFLQEREDEHHRRRQASSQGPAQDNNHEDPPRYHWQKMNFHSDVPDIEEFEDSQPEDQTGVPPLDRSVKGTGQNAEATSFLRRWWRGGQ